MGINVAISVSSFADSDDKPMRMLREAGIEVMPNPYGRRLTEEEIIIHLKDVDGLIAGLEPLNRRVIASANRLKAIARVGIGVNNVDFQAAADHSVKVSSTPDGPTQAVAELTIACMLSLCRQLPKTNADLHSGKWNKSIGLGLEDTPVLFVGYGRIGKAVAKLLRPFGPRILVCDPCFEPDETCQEATPVSLEEGLAQAKVITLHASGSRVILGDTQFDKMCPGTILLNSARAELVDERAMINGLENGKISGAWFDAFWEEPYRGELLRFPEVLLTPHVGTYTSQCRLSMESQAVTNLLRDLGVKPQPSLI